MDKSLILSRIKLAYSLKNDAELARFLEIQRNTLSNWYSRNTIDYDKVFLKCELLNFEWLLTGQGEMLKNAPVPEPAPQESHAGADRYTASLEKQITLLEKNNASLEYTISIQEKITTSQEREIQRQQEKITSKDQEIQRLKEKITQLKKEAKSHVFSPALVR